MGVDEYTFYCHCNISSNCRCGIKNQHLNFQFHPFLVQTLFMSYSSCPNEYTQYYFNTTHVKNAYFIYIFPPLYSGTQCPSPHSCVQAFELWLRSGTPSIWSSIHMRCSNAVSAESMCIYIVHFPIICVFFLVPRMSLDSRRNL